MATQQLSGDRNAQDGKDEEEEGDEEESAQGPGRGKEDTVSSGGGKGRSGDFVTKEELIVGLWWIWARRRS